MFYEVNGDISVYVIKESYEDEILKTFDKVTIKVEASNYDEAFNIAAKNEIVKHKDIAEQLFNDNGYDGSSQDIKRLIAFDDEEGNTLIDYDLFQMKLFDR